MKKTLAMVLTLVMLLGLAACGNKDAEPTLPQQTDALDAATQADESEVTEATEAKKDKPVIGKITAEDLNNYPEASPDDFVVFGDAETGYSIESYTGTNEIVVIPSKIRDIPVTQIGSGVFSNNSPVKAVKIPDTVTLIKDSVFGLNTNLEVVVFGSGVKEVQEGVLQNCVNLRELVLNDGLEKLGGLFAGGCKGLKSVVVPASVTDIHPMTFKGNSEDFVVYGAEGSAAQELANNRGLNFEVK